MSDSVLLFTGSSADITTGGLAKALRDIGATECDVLFIHSGMDLGLPYRGIRRKDLLAEMLHVLEDLHVGTLIFPTFTFSFCNNEPFDVQHSRTPMGALNEYARTHGTGVRSRDPLLSVFVMGDPFNLVDKPGRESIGRDSAYDRLHRCGKSAKFLFLGTDMRQCFTYTHYVEAIIGVPYRYNRTFTGTIIDNGAENVGQEAVLYTCYANCRLNPIPVVHNAMRAAGQLHTAPLGDTELCCFAEKDAWETLKSLLYENPLCLTDGTFDPTIHDTTYNNDTRIVSVK
ncbi:MAG: AAC(3) family N-acetyltransferase [Desulfovibrionaceae bacterium]|nr:AAC(3) family N-acetyltransferase [Desulfovibrionaceae bacterium]